MKAFIIDDEIANIDNLKYLISQYCKNVNVVGAASNTSDGKEFLLRNKIDILFLDIQLPDKSGFDLLTELRDYNFQIIFVTAFESYAIRAIKFSALDYLLKPINIDDLKQAVNKAQNNFSKQNSDIQLSALQSYFKEKNSKLKNIALQLNNEVRLVKLLDIVYCQSENNYTIFYLTTGEKLIVSKGLYEFDALLSDSGFIRCHQSYLMNAEYVKSLHRDGGSYYIETTFTQTIPVSRAKKDDVDKKILKT